MLVWVRIELVKEKKKKRLLWCQMGAVGGFGRSVYNHVLSRLIPGDRFTNIFQNYLVSAQVSKGVTTTHDDPVSTHRRCL